VDDDGGVREGRGVEKLGSVGDPALVVGVPGTVDWQPASIAPMASAHAATWRGFIVDKRTQRVWPGAGSPCLSCCRVGDVGAG
jgi:hypothetical protein